MNSNLPTLSSRLRQLLDLCGSGDELWDIGCDHGYIGLHALRTARFRKVCFVDASIDVITQLQQTLHSHIPKPSYNYEVLHCDGRQLIIPSSTPHFLMAGIGGRTIKSILERIGPQMRGGRAVLSPHGDMLELRKSLSWDKDWSLIGESVLIDEDRFYPVVIISRSEGKRVSLYGEEQWSTPEGLKYLRHLKTILPTHQGIEDQAYLAYLSQIL